MRGQGNRSPDGRWRHRLREPVIGCEVRGGSCRRSPERCRARCAAAAVVVRRGLGAVVQAAWKNYERCGGGPGQSACLEPGPMHGYGYKPADPGNACAAAHGTGTRSGVTWRRRCGNPACRACRGGLENPRTQLQNFSITASSDGGIPALKRFAGGAQRVSSGRARSFPARRARPPGAPGPAARADRRCARGSYPRPGARARACRRGRWSAAARWPLRPRRR